MQNKPLEYQLAVINAGGYVPDDDITITRFRYLVNHLAEETGEKPRRVADMTVLAQSQVRDNYGKDIKLLTLMEDANKLWPSSEPLNMSYAEMLALMIVTYGQ